MSNHLSPPNQVGYSGRPMFRPLEAVFGGKSSVPGSALKGQSDVGASMGAPRRGANAVATWLMIDRTGSGSLLLCLVAMVLAILLQTRTAWAEYLISPGDSLEISIVSLPELRQRAQVNLEGQVTYPLIGSLHVAGYSLADIQSKIKNELTNKSVRSRTPDGSERVVYIYPEEVSVTVAEYRPVYVNGDVSKPGEIPYRPSMTVRQAVALAGGLDVLKFRARDPNLEEFDLRSERSLLRMEHTRQQVMIARLSAELKGDKRLETAEEADTAHQFSDIEKAQTEQLVLALRDHDQEIKSLGRSLQQMQAQANTLERLQEQMTQGYQQQAAEVTRLRASFERGLASVARISEEQRALAFASERLLPRSLYSKDFRCLAPATVYPRALQPCREVPPDELLQPQDVFLVGVRQPPAHLRRERRRLGENTALDVPAQSGWEDPFDEDGVPRSQRSHPCVQSPDSRYAGGVVLDGRVRDETFVDTQEPEDFG